MAFLPVRFSASETVISIFFAKQSSIFLEENKDSCNISHTSQRLLTLPSLLPHHTKTCLYRAQASGGLHFAPMFCIAFADENRKPAFGREKCSQQVGSFRYQKPLRAGKTEKAKSFLPVGKSNFLQKQTKQTAQHFLLKHLPATSELLLGTPGAQVTTSPLSQQTQHIQRDVFLSISLRSIVIFRTVTGKSQSGPHSHPPERQN